MNPAAGVPDPVVSKTGTWKVATEKQSSARSGDPKSLEADGDEPEESGEGSGKGAHRTTSKAGKREVFWVAIEVEDEEDQPLAGQKVGITTPDGRYYIRELNGSGSTRIDGIPVEGECTVTLLGWQPTKAAPSIAENHWIEFEFVDEDGSALADHRIVITTPAGRRYQRRLDAKGRARVEAIPEKGACSVEIFPLPPAERRATANTATASTATANTARDQRRRNIGVQPRVVMARMRGMLFDTNKCFVLPTAIDALKRIREVYEANNPRELLVVGHTDTTAEPTINDPLSVERAKSVKAYLEDDVDTWLKNYDLPGKKKWGPREDRLMIIAMPDFGSRQEKEDLVKWFQAHRGLTVDGIAGPKTRKQLIAAYMTIDGVKLADQKHFYLSIKTHGAGENFPLDATGLALDQAAADGQEDRVDRRVELFFFDTEFGVEPPPGSPNGPEYLEWRARAQETEDLEVAGIQNEVTIVPITPAHFRTGSAAMLPEGETPTKDVGTATTSVGALAMALRFNEEHPDQKVLVAGHTDSVASDASNDKLSTQRAQAVHAVLTGDRDAFVSIADETHKVSDWKQILRWASVDLAVLFPLRASDDKGPQPGPVPAPFSFAACEPSAIDDNAFTGFEPSKAFQRAFNANKATLASTAADLKVDGEFGKKSWGAVFDCYQYNIARELGEDPAGVQALRDLLTFLPTKKPFVGFGEHHRADGNTADGAESQANRRVEVLFFAKGQEPDVGLIDDAPEITELYLPDVYRKQEIPQRPGGAKQHPLFAVSLLDVEGKQLVRAAGIPYTVKQAGVVLADEISQDGFGQFRIPPAVTSNVHVTWQPDPDGPIFSRTIALKGALKAGGKAVEDARLAALGYPFAEGTDQERIAAVQAFQRDHMLGEDPVTAGALPPAISAKLTQAFEADFEAPVPPPPDHKNDDTEETIDIHDDAELPTLAAGIDDTRELA